MSPTQAIDRLRHVIRRQHKALSTEATYAYWLRPYIHSLHEMPGDLPSEKKLERFLTDLAIKEDVKKGSCRANFKFNLPPSNSRISWRILPRSFRPLPHTAFRPVVEPPFFRSHILARSPFRS